jgi:hypothetical protein
MNQPQYLLAPDEHCLDLNLDTPLRTTGGLSSRRLRSISLLFRDSAPHPRVAIHHLDNNSFVSYYCPRLIVRSIKVFIMRLPSYQPIWLLFLSASPSLALFENFYFAGNKGNATGPVRCGDMTYDCPSPSMCSQDTLTRKWYCCETGNEVGPCWVGATKCEGTGTNVPGVNQVPCSNLGVNYCCLKEA